MDDILEQSYFNIALTSDQAQFVYDHLTNTPLPFRQVAPIVEAFQRAAAQNAARAQSAAMRGDSDQTSDDQAPGEPFGS